MQIGDSGTDFVLRGGRILDDAADSQPMDILVMGGEIAAVGRDLVVGDGVREVDASGRLVIPGLVNAHTHAHNNLSRALGDAWTLEDLRSRAPSLSGGRTPEEQYVSAAIGAIEMVKSGCTAAFDQFNSAGARTFGDEGVAAVVQAYRDVGLRAVLAPSVTDGSFYESIPGLRDSLPARLKKQIDALARPSAEELLGLMERAILRWHEAEGGRIRIGLAPTVPGECSEELLRGCRRLADKYGVMLHTHLVESKVQAMAALEAWGKTVVELLDSFGMLGPHFVGGHAVWVTASDISRLASSGSRVAHNPASNLRLGNGVAPVRELLAAGVPVGLGSDGSMSSDNQNMFEAMRIAALVSTMRFPLQPDEWITATDSWRMATASGAELLGWPGRYGQIQPGCQADLVLIDLRTTFHSPLNNVVTSLVYAETGASVQSVVVGGRFLVEDGKLLTIDETAVLKKAAELSAATLARNQELAVMADALDPYIRRASQTVASQPFEVDRYAPARGGGAVRAASSLQ